MKIKNFHERKIAKSMHEVGKILDTLASPNDHLWPYEKWPAMKFDKPLQVGAKGGHGPFRYFVRSYDPGKSISFEFTGPGGFNGYHGFKLERENTNSTMLIHVVDMKLNGFALLSWPIIFCPLHNALIEDSFDKVDNTVKVNSWSVWVKFLRWIFNHAKILRKSSKHSK